MYTIRPRISTWFGTAIAQSQTRSSRDASGHINRPYHPCGGNVFEDLGFEPREAAKLKFKAESMSQLGEWIKAQHLTQADAARLLQVTSPRVSDLMRGKWDKFSIDALVDMLERTGKLVTVRLV